MINAKKNNNEKGKNKQTLEQNKEEIFVNIESKIKEVLSNMNKKEKKELDEALGKGEFIEHLRNTFQEKYPNLLDQIENKDKLKIYIEQLKKQGFTIEDLIKNSVSLDISFKENENEYEATKKSLKKLEEYCENEKESLPNSIFRDFAAFVKIETTPIAIDEKSKIKKASDLRNQRTKFLEDKKINLNETDKKNTEKIMNPKYAPTTRLLLSAAIKKIKRNLPKPLIKDFEKRFPLPITITSEIQNLGELKNEWILFLNDKKNNIDKETAKKLDKIKVFNEDIYEEFEEEGIDFDKTKGFSEQEQAFRIVFNKLATRQLFDEVSKKNTIAEMQIENIGEIFNGFPPYLNDIFKSIPYQEQNIKKTDPVFKNDIEEIDAQIDELKKGDKEESDENNETKIKKLNELKTKRNKRKREAYVQYISKTQENKKEIGEALKVLVQSNFDVSKIDKDHQQTILNILVQEKLEKVINSGVAESLGVDEKKFSSFIKNFFDLNQKKINIPSPNGDISIDCLEKSFLGGPLIQQAEIGLMGPELAEIDKKNLPLNMKLLLTEDNKDYFEKSPIFSGLFYEFKGKNKTEKLNDSYKVKITNSKGDTVTGYLSSYPPKGNENQYNTNSSLQNGGERFLYSKPITRPEDDRKLVFWDKEKPAIIKGNEEGLYNIEVEERELNLNGEAIGGLLFGATVGQHAEENQLDREQINELEQKFEKLSRENVYIDTIDQKEQKGKQTEEKKKNKTETSEENTSEKEFYEARNTLKGYQTKNENKEKENTYGFEVGAKILVPNKESILQPEKGGSKTYVNMEIININKEQKTFKVKITGGETKLNGNEGKEITLALSSESINTMKETFGKDIYKLPPNIDKNQNNMIHILEQSDIQNVKPSKFFRDLQRNGKTRTKDIGNKKEEIIYFGKSEIASGEDVASEPTMETICKVKYNEGSPKPYTIYIYDKEKGKDPIKQKTEMDAVNFAIFISSKKLYPKTKDEIEKKEKEDKSIIEQANIGKKIPITISGIQNLFKTVGKKINDALKKYGDQQEEDFIESVMFEGKIMSKLAGIMPTDKLKNAFSKVGDEYIAERDNKIRKKIEDYIKFYKGDPDFGGEKMWGTHIEPYLKGQKPFKNQRQAAGMLIATIEKGKGPYSRNTDWAGKGMWIRALMGPGHQQRYLKEKEKLETQLKEGINTNGQGWANNLQDEILKLEMQYITHVIDGRKMRSDDTPVLEQMFSKKFAGELESVSNNFFKGTNSDAYEKAKDNSIELARFEYFRLLGDRPQQAIGNLKVFAEKAVTPAQWKVFESMVLTGMLSGVFNSMTQSDKKGIEQVCRATGFLPGLLNRQPNVHQKIAKLLKLATGKDITYGKNKKIYNPANFDFGKMESTNQAKDFVNYETGFNARYNEGNNSKLIKDFLSFSGTNVNGEKLIDIYENPKTEFDTKLLLGEIIGKRYETNETPDSQVMGNGKSLQQNILCRNHSIINDIIRFQDGEFKGKDKDTIEDTKETRGSIKKEISGYNITSNNDVIYMMKLFANRFSEKGFSSEEKKNLIKTLRTVQALKAENNPDNKESIKQILRYSIVGKIIRSSGNGQVPDELKEALEAFEKFFENNLDKILQKDVIAKGFGEEYAEELDKKMYKIAPWDRYVKTIVYNRGALLSTLSKEEKKKIQDDKIQYEQETYLNKRIYKIASDLEEREYGIPNGFKAMFDINKDKKDIKQELEEALSGKAIAIKNHIQIQKAEKKERLDTEILTKEEQEIADAELEDEDEDYDDYDAAA